MAKKRHYIDKENKKFKQLPHQEEQVKTNKGMAVHWHGFFQQLGFVVQGVTWWESQ